MPHLSCVKDNNALDLILGANVYVQGLPSTLSSGNMVLGTFGFSNSQKAMYADIHALWTGALWCVVIAFGVLVLSAQGPYFQMKLARLCQVWSRGPLA